MKNKKGQTETLQTTAEHPFWIKDTGWLKASLLEQGMILLDRNNQEVEVISQYLLPNHTDTVYNIEVDDFHTYHVGRLGVWVHNADCCGVGVVSGNIVNKAGVFYPNVLDPRTGRPIPFPNETLKIVPKANRVTWNNQERYKFIKAWHEKGYPEPRGGWSEYDIHHIKPREYGGDK
ncbi:polymorphic toxin-type HINT domain-containing protein [Moraxella bovoculi]|uniref:polymorphic toxin-type HINT domain-containing protein n=1 Tax=Moraxella bovoculi TaxID=386891 RepID=UPI003F4FE308